MKGFKYKLQRFPLVVFGCRSFVVAAVSCRGLAFGFYGFMGFGFARICCWAFAVAGFRCKDSVLAENSCRVFVCWYLLYGITIAQLSCRSFGLCL